MPLWIGHTRSIRYAAYQCMGLQSATSLAKKLMLRALCASCLVTWSPEYLCSLLVYVFIIKMDNCHMHCCDDFIVIYAWLIMQFVDEACHQIERNERNVRQMGVLSYIPR